MASSDIQRSPGDTFTKHTESITDAESISTSHTMVHVPQDESGDNAADINGHRLSVNSPAETGVMKRKRGRPPKRRSPSGDSVQNQPPCSVVLHRLNTGQLSGAGKQQKTIDSPVSALESEVPSPKCKRGRPSKTLDYSPGSTTPVPLAGSGPALEEPETDNVKTEINGGDLESEDIIQASKVSASKPKSTHGNPHSPKQPTNGPKIDVRVPKSKAKPDVCVNTQLDPVEFSDTEPDGFSVVRPNLSHLTVVPSAAQVAQRVDEVHGLLLLWGDYDSYKAETGGWLHQNVTRTMEVATEADGAIRANMEVILCLTPKKSDRLAISDVTALNVDRMRSVLPKLRRGEWSKIIHSSSSCTYHQDECIENQDGKDKDKGKEKDPMMKLHLKREVLINVSQMTGI